MATSALGRRIRQLRGTRTLRAIDKLAQLGVSKLSKLERGDEDNPTLDTIQRVARGLGVPVKQLFESEPRPERDAGHAATSGGRGSEAGVGGDPFYEAIREQMLAIVDRDDPAPDTIEGDVLKAHALLTRAVQRIGRARAASGNPRGDGTE